GSTTERPVAAGAVLVRKGAPVATGYGPTSIDGKPPPMLADVVPLMREITTKLSGTSRLARMTLRRMDSLRAFAELRLICSKRPSIESTIAHDAVTAAHRPRDAIRMRYLNRHTPMQPPNATPR